MPGLMFDQGEKIALEALLNLGLTLHLYTNDYTPVDGSVETNFTEATFPGYAPIDFTDASAWSTVAGAPTEASLPQQTFTANATVSPTQSIRGYYFTVTGTGKGVWGEKFDVPRLMAQSGDYVKLTPKMQYKKTGE